jgi:hypothetical protein
MEEDSSPECEADSAEEYARQALLDIDGPVQATDLAEEYGCTSGHMRRVLRELSAPAEGFAVWVDPGAYLHRDDVDDEDLASWSDETDAVAPGLFGHGVREIVGAFGLVFLFAVVMEVGQAVGKRLAPSRY